MSNANRPAMLPGERTDAYMRRTAFHPPHWTIEQSQIFDAKVHERQMIGDRRWLRRYGLNNDVA